MTQHQPAEADKLCRYSLAHKLAKVPAVTVVDCGPVGIVPACQACADFYARMSGSGERESQ